jgi:RNA polymerase-binding transcription factor DksA
MATAKKPAAKKTPAAKPSAKRTSTSRAPSTPKKAAGKAPAKAPAKKSPAAAKAPAKRTTSKKAGGAAVRATAAPHPTPNGADVDLPTPRGVTKDGITYTKDFDVKFLKAQRDLLTDARRKLAGQATRLEDEANSLIEDGEMGDVQFDDESGEGDTMVVERERDLALSAQARQTIADIDAALARITSGTYGYSEVSGRPIPRERLEAIPWATVLVEEKVGGIGRR